jgi:hypothetical protein
MTRDFWMVELVGHRDDLNCFQRWFSEEPAKVINEDDKFFLTGTHLLGSKTADEVIHRAETKLELMTAAARLESASEAVNVKIGSAVYVDSAGLYYYHVFVEAETRSVVSVRCFDSSSPSLPQRAVAIADCDSHLDMALRLWGEASRSWPRLFRIVEEITYSFEPDPKKHMSEVLLSENLIESRDDILRFRYSACDPGVAGRESRHANGSYMMPQELKNLPNPTMTHHEAVALVGSVLSRAMRRKWEARSEVSSNH